MLHAKHLTLVELNTEFFDYLRNRFAAQLSKLRFYQTRDYELEGVESSSIDFGFSFGVFVHIDPKASRPIWPNSRVVKSGGHIVIQYADKTRRRTGAHRFLRHDPG
ncbi:MAG: class I SAM-dependent methyltransferase [Chloroflexi bacterium]|nr:class I SAM-dependent methyltransferase [Chloroflexota bacterium]